MTADTNVIDNVSEGSNVELKGKSALNLSSSGDLENASGADCNDIATRKEEEFGRVTKDETDSSYVFVNGGSDDPAEGDLDVIDPEEDLGAKAIPEQIDEPGSSSGQKSEELKEVKGETGESCDENGGIIDSEELGEHKEENGEICVENGSPVEETEVSLAVDPPHENSTPSVIEDVVEAEDNKESQIAVVEVVESELEISSLTEQTMAESEELKEEIGERGESCVENICIEKNNVISSGAESELLTEKGEGCGSSVANGGFVEESCVSLSTNGLHDGFNRDELVENGDTVRSQKEFELVVEVADSQSQQSQIIAVTEGVESEISAASLSEQTAVENLKKEKEEGQESSMDDSCVVEEIAVSNDIELEQLGEQIEENAESCVAEEVEETAERCLADHSIAVEESGVSMSRDGVHDEQNKDDVEAEDIFESEKLELTAEADEDKSSENEVIENVESEDSKLHLVVQGNGTEMSNITGMEQELKSNSSDREVKLENEAADGPIELSESQTECTGERGMEQESNCSDHEVKLEIEVPDGLIELSELQTESTDELGMEQELKSNCSGNGRDLPISAVNDMKLEGAVENGSAVEVHQIDNLKSENENRKGHLETIDNGFIGAKVDGLELETKAAESIVSPTNENLQSAKDEVKLECEEKNVSLDNSEKSADPSASTLDGMKSDLELGKKIFNFIIKIPRYADDGLRSQIKTAQLQVDEKTQHRDSIRVAMQKQKAKCIEYREKFESARLEERASRDAVIAKRKEIDSIQIVINRMRNATSIEEIEERIHNIEHSIQHETMPLTEEKQLLREIKQLKNVREQLCANTGTHAQIKDAFDQKDSVEDRFKSLKKELDSLRGEIQRTEEITNLAKKKHYDEFEKLKELQAQFKGADNLRQEAYASLQELKRKSYEKNKYFRMYKEDERIAEEYASKGDREALQRHCTDQVEKVMELWNNSDEFRKDYVKHNMMSTLRRFKTLDGRSLGPNEEPHVIRNLVEERTDATHLPSTESSTSAVASTPEMKLEEPSVSLSTKESVEKPEVGSKNLSGKSKKSTKPSSKESVLVTGSSWADVVEETENESKRTKEEEEAAKKAEELAKKEEELRKEEAAARLKEQRRLEEKAKAKEAEERKKRNAEKAQARAELRAQKEAELKEKEREKRLRKKERKMAASAGIMNGGFEGIPAEVSENTQPEATKEPEIKEKSAVATKRTSKSLPAAKQSKTKPIPPPLRNRGKRKMQSWMWVLLVAVLLIALFFLGNSIPSFKFSLRGFGF